MGIKRTNLIESISILGVYLIAALSSIINIGTAGSALFALLVVISIIVSSRNAFLLMFITFYVPTGGLSLPIGPLILITLSTIVIRFKDIINAKRGAGIKTLTILLLLITAFRFLAFPFVRDYSLYFSFLLSAVYTLLQVLVVPSLIKDEDINYVLKWWVLFGAFAAILGYIHHIMEGSTYLAEIVSMSNERGDSSFEVEGFVGWMRWIWAGVEPNFHGALLLLPFAIALNNMMKKGSIVNIVLWGLIMLGIVGTFSRTSFMVSILTLLLALFFSKSVKHKGAIAFLVVVFFSVTIYSYQDYVERLLTISDNIKTQGGSGRFELYEEALNNIASNPIVGIGTGQTRLYSRTKMDSHNTYLQLFAENGIVCFLIAIYLIVFVFKRAIRIREKNAVFLLGLFAICLNLNTVSMFDLRPLVSFVVLLFIYKGNYESVSSDISRIPSRDWGLSKSSFSNSEELGVSRG